MRKDIAIFPEKNRTRHFSYVTMKPVISPFCGENRTQESLLEEGDGGLQVCATKIYFI